MGTLIEAIKSAVIGDKQLLTTPFGRKPLVYADYTASGRGLTFIEDYIRDQVLPWYANTHTATTVTGAQTTALREQARELIRRAVNGSDSDKVIFCGSGATAAINKLIDIMNLRLPRELAQRYELNEQIPKGDRPAVFIGPYEHHSNELPWRESIAEVVAIPLDSTGQIDLKALESALKRFANRPLLIGSFSAASNVTGVKSDVAAVTALLKQHDALAFWDYAAAAPYVGINVNADTPIDAVFISPHKFIGGPGTPGVLVVKDHVLTNSVPAVVGGGTVVYVTPEDHRFIDDHERREEGGTPAIVESIRAGLVFKLQQDVGVECIEEREAAFVERAISRLKASQNIEILGDADAPRLSILSLRFRHGEKDLHYGFVVSLLNDLFGIQVRGGCSCAGPYGHSLLGMDMAYSRAIEREIRAGAMVLRPGWVRLNFNYFIDDREFEYLLSALELVAEHGWRLLPYYQFDEADGVWRFEGRDMEYPSNLEALDFLEYCEREEPVTERVSCMSLDAVIDAARETLLEERSGRHYSMRLSDSADALRWFVLPQEVASDLSPSSSAA